jgi:flagellar biosynthesis/type III secretory pathway M-ring protein FliF/YscJ
MPPIPDSTLKRIAYEFVREFKQGFMDAIQETGENYQAQTGDNGGAIKLAIYILIAIAVYFAIDQRLQRRQDRKDRIEAARLQREHEKDVADKCSDQRREDSELRAKEAERLGAERKEGRDELLGAVSNVNKNAVDGIARIGKDVERFRDEFRGAIAGIDSRTSKLEGKMEK